jgi:hypothetical protein
LFKTSFISWRDARLPDIGATCHMNFWRDFFEELNDNVDGAVNFVDGFILKHSGIDTIWLKLLGFLEFLLHNVLYLPELRRNLFLVQI